MSHHVFVLRYEHRHGAEITAYASEALARKARADLCAQWAHELPTKVDAEKVKELYAAGLYDECASHYLAVHPSESMDIEDLEIMCIDAGVRVIDAVTEVVHHALILPTSRDPGLSLCQRNFWWSSTEGVSFPVNTQNMRVTLPPSQPPLTCLECIAQGEPT